MSSRGWSASLIPRVTLYPTLIIVTGWSSFLYPGYDLLSSPLSARFMVCGLNGRREIRVCQNPEETFHLQQRLCLRREEAHCQKTGRRRLWNTDTAGLQVRLYQELKALKRFTRSLTEDVLQEVECEKDPEGYIVPDPHYCNRYASLHWINLTEMISLLF